MINGANAQADAHTDGRERLVKMILGRFRAAAMKKRRPASWGSSPAAPPTTEESKIWTPNRLTLKLCAPKGIG
jgi:hypothetical protein